MYYVYIIESNLTQKYYIGYTRDYNLRWNTHRFTSKFKRSKLYDCIRKYDFDNFELVLINAFENKQEALDFERSLISLDDNDCLNLAPGGEGGFVVQNKNEWQKKLSISRQGRKPALGIKHSEENKKKFSDAGKKRWDIYGRYPLEVLELPFRLAHEEYGISKTHYYRLVKQLLFNAQ